MIRTLILIAIAALPEFASAIAAEPAPSPPGFICEEKSPGYDSRLVTCPISASGSAQRIRFKANFSGGHDDTMASMTPMLDGAPLVCDAGSKLELIGEDGNVSLECRFSLNDKAGNKHVLSTTVHFSHAQYESCEFGIE